MARRLLRLRLLAQEAERSEGRRESEDEAELEAMAGFRLGFRV